MGRQIRELPNHVDFDKPILTLAAAIQQVGNLGAHFDIEGEPDGETTALMLDLLDYLIEYLYVLPGRIERLHEAIGKLAGGTTNVTGAAEVTEVAD